MNKEELIIKLEEKYAAEGQPIEAYLEGLLHAKAINYWDYIQVDALFSLQKPRTNFPDEVIFLMYHQVTELLLKLVTHELEQATAEEGITGPILLEKITRAKRYTEVAQMSFDVMREGMDPEQYGQFRHTLTPASGFQSATFREIEFYCTDMWNLVMNRKKEELKGSGDQEKYMKTFRKLANRYQKRNLWQQYLALPEVEKTSELIAIMKEFDHVFNVKWPLVHLRTAEHYLEHGKEVKAATGGSEWKKYLHPSYQRRMFFPELLTEQELENWGKD
jgi:tryptophan 2,3-dioxygenase